MLTLPGAGFYINATNAKWSKHYNMYDLIVKELPEVLKAANLGLVSGWIVTERVIVTLCPDLTELHCVER